MTIVGVREVLVITVVTGQGAIVAVEDNANHLGRIERTERFEEQPSWRFVGADDDQEPVGPSSNEPAIRQRNERRRIDQNVIIEIASLSQEIFESRRIQQLIRPTLRRASGHHR
jgi:hypothetical protein